MNDSYKFTKLFLFISIFILLSSLASASTANYLGWTSNNTILEGETAELEFMALAFTGDSVFITMSIDSNVMGYQNLVYNGVQLYNAEFDNPVSGYITLTDLEPGYYHIQLYSEDEFGSSGDNAHLYLIVTENGGGFNHVPTFSGIIPDQTIYDGELFTDVNLNNYFNDIDVGDELIFIANNNDLIINFDNGLASINYSGLVSEVITFTACDLANECVDSNEVTFTVLEDTQENNILQFESDFADIEMYVADEAQIDLYANTIYTDANGNSLNLATLDYSIQDSTCEGIVYFEFDGEELTVSSSNNVDECDFNIYVEETIYSNEMQSDLSNMIHVNIIAEPQLYIVDIDCQFDPIPIDETQTCTVTVEDQSGAPLEGAEVELYDLDSNELLDVCTTEFMGTCGAEFIVDELGIQTVYAFAFMDNYIEDTTASVTDSFEVVADLYEIADFFIYDDESGFGTYLEVTEFFRGEDIYVEFTVLENGVQIYEQLISNVSLYDETSGAVIEMELLDFENGIYYYELDMIPLSDDFLGENFVFTYVLDNFFGSGQAYKTIDIYNNFPVWDVIATQTLEVEETIEIDLDVYASDLEDDFIGEELDFSILSYPQTNVNVDLVNSILIITGVEQGTGTIVLEVQDSEGDTETTSFEVQVNALQPQLIAYFDASARVHMQDVVTFDATDSQGDIIEYSWDFGDGSTSSRKIRPPTSIEVPNNIPNIRGTGINVNSRQEIIEHIYTDFGFMTVTLTVTDTYGNTDTYSRVINVDARGACSDGLDNDGDGLIDMEDPGCQESDGKSEFNLNTGLESGLMFESINVYSYDYFAHPGDDVFVNVKLKNRADDDIEDLRVTIMIADLGIKIKSSKFDLDEDDSKLLKMSFYIPYDVQADEYPIRVSVANDDIIHSRYRFVNVQI